MNDKPIFGLRAALLISWCLALGAILALMGPGRAISFFSTVTPDNIRSYVSSFGQLSALAYILLNALRPFVFLPVTPFTVAGGYIFGVFPGFILTLIGRTLISAFVTFGLSRYIFKDYVRSLLQARYAAWDEKLDEGGVVYVAVMRMFPLLPFDVVGYVAGVSRISLRKYMIGTLIGDIPGVFVLTFLGGGLVEPGSMHFYLSIALAIVVAAVSWLYIFLFVKKKSQKQEKLMAGPK